MAETELCIEKHKSVNKRLENLETDVDELKMSDAINTNEIKNLCNQIRDLVNVLKWFIGITITSLAGFFFFVIQNNLR